MDYIPKEASFTLTVSLDEISDNSFYLFTYFSDDLIEVTSCSENLKTNGSSINLSKGSKKEINFTIKGKEALGGNSRPVMLFCLFGDQGAFSVNNIKKLTSEIIRIPVGIR